MIEDYIAWVGEIYIPMLQALAIGSLIASAIAPLIGTPQSHPKPLGVIFFLTSICVAWPLVLPALFAGVALVAIVGGSTLIYTASLNLAKSKRYAQLKDKLRALFATG